MATVHIINGSTLFLLELFVLCVGFAARELSTRIRHAEPKVIISASCGVEPSRIIRYIRRLDDGGLMAS
jgi:acyl-coenzyme A synthetase/AMP-(fatty) acid ligase